MGHIAQRVAAGPPRDGVKIRTGATAASYDASPAWTEIPMGAERVSIAFEYTSGSNTGYASLRPAFKAGVSGDVEFRDIDTGAVTISGNEASRPVALLRVLLPAPGGPGATVRGVVVVRVPPGMTHIAALAAEVGDPGNVGNLSLWFLSGV